jgi:DNA-binding transcriptional ArsR family regulator
MDQRQALMAFGAISQETRLEILCLLVRAGPQGVAAGAIGDAVKVSPSNVSFHLKELERAGLIAVRREARSMIYSAEYKALRALIQFLMEDCCAGHPDVCEPAMAASCADAE